MKLYIEDGEALPAVKYLEDADPAPDGYTETTDPSDWNSHIVSIDAIYSDVRNEMIDQFEASWAGYSDAQKQALVQNYVYPSETSTEDLDALYTEAERDDYQDVVMFKMNIGITHVIMSSASRKHFEVKVNDSGTLSTTEIKTDIKI